MKRREFLVDLFKACNNGESVAQLHSQILKSGFSHDSLFATKLSSLYAKHVSTDKASKLFDETPQRTVFLWNSILRSHCRDKQWRKTLFLFSHMMSDGITDEVKPDGFTVPIVLKACAELRSLKHGKMVHGYMKKNNEIGEDLFVGSALIELYSKCGQMDYALRVFKEFSQPDVVLWTSMVTGYEQNGYAEKAVEIFSDMVVRQQVFPDPVTLVSLVSACAQLVNFRLGSCVHGFVIRREFDSDLSLVNSLLNLYAKTGFVKVAAMLFKQMTEKDVVSWSSMIACYAHNGAATEALDVYHEMMSQGVEPSSVTVISALQACSISCNLVEGKKIHELAARKGFDVEVSVSTALIDMYMKCFSPDEATDIFRKMPRKDVVSWAAMLSGFAQNGMAYKSIGAFKDMLFSGTQPDAVAMVKILASSSELGSFQLAICLHGYLIRIGFECNVFLGASLIEVYTKCGSLKNAIKVFEAITHKDVVIWSAMIAAHGIHGQGEKALNLFDQMIKDSAATPNDTTFLSVLSACSHAGFIQEGIEIFNKMKNEYGLVPSSEHYGIMVDLLGRVGELDKGMDIINGMTIPVGPHVWGALLGACRIHHNVEMGEIAAKNLFLLDPSHSGYYILLSNIYAVEGKWANVTGIRTLIKDKGFKKMVAHSSVEVHNEVHSFVADERLHPKCEQIYELLTQVEVQMKEEGCIPFADFLFHGTMAVL